MKWLPSRFALGLTCAMLVVAPLRAADREHQQIMADIRMLQEQTARLTLMLGTLDDTLHTLLTKLDAQSDDLRRAFADQRLLVDNVTGGVRVVREKVDETNVRLSSLAQEVEALRLAMPRMTAQLTQLAVDPDTGLPTTPLPTPVALAGVNPGVSPQRLYDTAYADYTTGQWALSMQGFTRIHQYVSPIRAGRRCPVLHRPELLCRREVSRGGRGVRAGRTELSRW